MELSALERLKYPYILIMVKMVYPCTFMIVFDPILLILADTENMH